MSVTKQLILDIAMNLTRIGNWMADDYTGKQKRISIFFGHTDACLETLKNSEIPVRLRPTVQQLLAVYPDLRKHDTGTLPTVAWAESLMTWGLILTHRASLI